jgi:hypothetical protein
VTLVMSPGSEFINGGLAVTGMKSQAGLGISVSH